MDAFIRHLKEGTNNYYFPWVITLFLLVLFLCEFLPPTEQEDDAFITYRYAQNLAEGYGLVFNIGERVEGYTNFLWALLVAGGVYLGWQAPDVGYLLAICSSLLFLIATNALALTVLAKPYTWLAPLAPLILYSSNSFTAWAASGLETPLFGALLILALIAYLKSRPLLVACLCVLLTMTRPEGVLVGGLLLGWDWITRLNRDSLRNFRDSLINSDVHL